MAGGLARLLRICALLLGILWAAGLVAAHALYVSACLGPAADGVAAHPGAGAPSTVVPGLASHLRMAPSAGATAMGGAGAEVVEARAAWKPAPALGAESAPR